MNAFMASVPSADGTDIAYWSSGQGPPLILVHGAMADHHRWGPLLPLLEPHFTVHAMDRRGRGDSGDAPGYSVRREFEDVAAVVDAVFLAAGSPANVYGHSYGGLCAFGGASLTPNVGRLVLYEGWPAVDLEAMATPSAVWERLNVLVSRGERETALELVMREVVLMPDHEVAAVRAQPSWPARVAAVHTVPRELVGIVEVAFDPATARLVEAPTLLLTGSDSPDPAAADIATVAAGMPDARIEVIQGQQHVADVLAPAIFSQILIAFCTG